MRYFKQGNRELLQLSQKKKKSMVKRRRRKKRKMRRIERRGGGRGGERRRNTSQKNQMYLIKIQGLAMCSFDHPSKVQTQLIQSKGCLPDEMTFSNFLRKEACSLL